MRTAKNGFLDHAGADGLRRPIAFAHRGYSRTGLENTLQAFRAAVDLGYGYIETDVHTTADGVVVLFHDDTLERVTDGLGSVQSLTFAQLQELRIREQEPIPTLDELLETLPHVRINIDIKDAASILPLRAVLDKHNAYGRVCITSFSDRRVLAFTALTPLTRVTNSAGMLRVAAFVIFGALGWDWLLRPILASVDVLQVPVKYKFIRIVSAASLARAHRLGLPMHVWTINDAPGMRALLDLNVDGIMTDRADLLAEIMAERGFWPQAGGR